MSWLFIRNAEVVSEHETLAEAKKARDDQKLSDRALLFSKRKWQKLARTLGAHKIAEMIDADSNYLIAFVTPEEVSDVGKN